VYRAADCGVSFALPSAAEANNELNGVDSKRRRRRRHRRRCRVWPNHLMQGMLLNPGTRTVIALQAT